MITPMKKVTILTMAGAVEESLAALRSMEILHVTPLQNASGSKLNAAKGELNRVQKALENVPEKAPKGVTAVAADTDVSSVSLVDEVQQLMAEAKQAELDKEQAQTELSKLQKFGNLDPATAAALIQKGVFVKLYVADVRAVPFGIEGEGFVQEFGADDSGTYYAVFSRGDSAAVATGHYAEIPMPVKSLADYREMEANAIATLQRVEKRLGELSGVRKQIESRLSEVTDDYNMAETAAGMVGDTNVSALQGFCPAPRIAELQAAAKKNGWGLMVDDPTDEDEVPTLLGYNKLTKPMQCLYSLIGISPGYREVDVSSVFLCFFSIFFAMIVGDTAYGILFLAITLFIRKKMPNANSAGFHFMYLMSGTTILWGAINASFLGFTPEIAGWSYYLDIANYNFIPDSVRNVLYWIRSVAPSDPARFEVYKQFCQGFTFLPESFTPNAPGASQMQHIQLFCFCIAVVHLSIAHAWNVVVRIQRKSSTFMAQVGWLMGAWVMFFLACNMVLGIEMPGFVIPMFIAEVVLLLLFTVPPSRLKQDFISIPMLILDIVNSFTDVISYIRLFAVGMSGAAIAEAFNGMLSPMFGSAIGIAGAAVILLFVHGLNIALAVMGVAVHAVRLNTLEFSNGLGLEWSGFAFTPFAKQKN
ncbi:MAG: ATPase [Fibrobacter sp.]|nr:ATPase [Fibrobacter sp.]